MLKLSNLVLLLVVAAGLDLQLNPQVSIVPLICLTVIFVITYMGDFDQ